MRLSLLTLLTVVSTDVFANVDFLELVLSPLSDRLAYTPSSILFIDDPDCKHSANVNCKALHHKALKKQHHVHVHHSSLHASTNVTDDVDSIPFIPDPSAYVDEFIGTINGGHDFPGATLPLGMAKPGIDTTSPDNQAGYTGDGYPVKGVSQLHDQGTGGSPSLGNFPLFPLVKCDSFTTCPVNMEDRAMNRTNNSDVASPGFFSTQLVNDVTIELTASLKTALHRYTFPNISEPYLVVDLSNDLSRSFRGGNLTIDKKTGRVQGGGTFVPSFGFNPKFYNAYFCADFTGGKVKEYGVWVNGVIGQGLDKLELAYNRLDAPAQAGALLQFENVQNEQVVARVGLSFISSAQACQNADQDIPQFDRQFEQVASFAQGEWDKYLRPVQIDPTNVNSTYVTLLYSSLYRTAVVPANYTSENPDWKSKEPYFDSLYCTWDTYRSVAPLQAIVNPIGQAQIVRSYIDTAEHEGGWVPECRMSLSQGFTQGGSNGDHILADFLIKYPKQAKKLGVDINKAYRALVQDAEVEPPQWNTIGRQANAWKQYGYIPKDVLDPTGTGLQTREASRTLEYSYNDFAVAQVASMLSKKDEVKKYKTRASNWQTLWDHSVTSRGFKGFMQTKYPNGSFFYTPPLNCSPVDTNPTPCSLTPDNNGGFYEASSWEYSFYAPHDTASIIRLMGGAKEFTRRLDYFFANGLFDPSNEPSFQIPWMYNYVGKPVSTVDQVRNVIASNYSDTVGGIPGNDDSGAMGSYAVFFLLGFWPVPSTDNYLLATPYFPEVQITNPITGKTATIRSIGFDGNKKRIYVKSATLNGKPYTKNWITHDFFTNGGTLELTLTSSKKSTWGTGKDDIPPSLSTGGFL